MDGAAAGFVDGRHGDGPQPLAVARGDEVGSTWRTCSNATSRGSGPIRPTPVPSRGGSCGPRSRARRSRTRRGSSGNAVDPRCRRGRERDVLRAARSLPGRDARRLLIEEAPALSAITHWDERCRTACLAVAHGRRPRARRGSRGRRGGGRRGGARATGGRGWSSSSPRPAVLGGSTAPTWASRSSRRGSGCRSSSRGSRSRMGSDTSCRSGGDTDTNGAVAGALLGAATAASTPETVAREVGGAGRDRSGGRGAGGGDGLGGRRRPDPRHVLVVDPPDDADRLELGQRPDHLAERDPEPVAIPSIVHTAAGSAKDPRDRADVRWSSEPMCPPRSSVGRTRPRGPGSRDASCVVRRAFIHVSTGLRRRASADGREYGAA